MEEDAEEEEKEEGGTATNSGALLLCGANIFTESSSGVHSRGWKTPKSISDDDEDDDGEKDEEDLLEEVVEFAKRGDTAPFLPRRLESVLMDRRRFLSFPLGLNSPRSFFPLRFIAPR